MPARKRRDVDSLIEARSRHVGKSGPWRRKRLKTLDPASAQPNEDEDEYDSGHDVGSGLRLHEIDHDSNQLALPKR
jgi:hypothetical protein